MGYLYIFATILFTVYGQMILKWRISKIGFSLDSCLGIWDKLWSLFKFVFDPWIFSGFVSAFVASLFWMAAMTKFQITYAYPFMSLSPALVFVLGILLLGETFTIGKLIGLSVIILGIFITAKF